VEEESVDFGSVGEEGGSCATASAARKDNAKIDRRILFMLNLKAGIISEPAYFPKHNSLDAKPPGMVFLNSNPLRRNWGKTPPLRSRIYCPKVLGLGDFRL
jgi:hypothetical protein